MSRHQLRSGSSFVAPANFSCEPTGQTSSRNCLHCILPPHILRKLLESPDPEIRQAALETLMSSSKLRGEREVRTLFASATGPADGRRTIFDCKHSTNLASAQIARSEDGPASADASVNRAFDGFGKTYQFYKTVLKRNSIDDRGMRLNGYVHRGTGYNNAFWDGQEMVFGDGDGRLFSDFTKSLDVIAHELTHGVTQFTAGLEYHNQPGALNESISDVFGSLVKQWSLGQTADQADWLVGKEIFTPSLSNDALRSLKAPGEAYNNNILGKDPQPAHMDKYVRLPDDDQHDFGGVHINSGIPNKAFYLTAKDIGGHAWEAAGHIWYETVKASAATTDFLGFASTAYVKAGVLYGTASREQKAVLGAWDAVGIKIPHGPVLSDRRSRDDADRDGVDNAAALARQIEMLSMQVQRLAENVSGMRGGQ
jgi:Zn-dependent metalloprotease